MAPNTGIDPPDRDPAPSGSQESVAANLDVVRELEAERATNSALRRRLAEAESVAAAALERAGRAKAGLAAADKRASEADWVAKTAGREASKADTAVALAMRRAAESEARARDADQRAEEAFRDASQRVEEAVRDANQRVEEATRERVAAEQRGARERMESESRLAEERRKAEETNWMLRAALADAADHLARNLTAVRIPITDLARSRMLKLIRIVSGRPQATLQRAVQALSDADQSLAAVRRLQHAEKTTAIAHVPSPTAPQTDAGARPLVRILSEPA
jgi:hypothetical protein